MQRHIRQQKLSLGENIRQQKLNREGDIRQQKSSCSGDIRQQKLRQGGDIRQQKLTQGKTFADKKRNLDQVSADQNGVRSRTSFKFCVVICFVNKANASNGAHVHCNSNQMRTQRIPGCLFIVRV